MAGRKTKLTPEVQERIVQALGVGATKCLACQYAGIHPGTFFDWLKWGEAGKQPFAEFADAVKRAEARAVVGWLTQMERAAMAGNWQAAAWKLERRYPKEYGRRRVEDAFTNVPDIQVHVQTARERLLLRVEGLAIRHAEDASAGDG